MKIERSESHSSVVLPGQRAYSRFVKADVLSQSSTALVEMLLVCVEFVDIIRSKSWQ